MTNKQAWTDNENGAVVALYFRMLDKAEQLQPYNKAAMIRELQGIKGADGVTRNPFAELAGRSRGSIEAKLMNASAAHAALDPNAITMDGYGYRALSNYQKTLQTTMRATMMLHGRSFEALAS